MDFLRAWGVALVACAACAPEPKPATAVTSPPATASTTAAAPAPAPPPPPATATDVVTAGRASFDACHARARKEHPTLGRTAVEMTFTIDPDGTPKHVDFRFRHPVDDKLKDCLRDAAMALHFPASMQGQQTGTVVLAPPGP